MLSAFSVDAAPDSYRDRRLMLVHLSMNDSIVEVE